jgi:predicted N-acetyltransferase YhbS
MVKIQSEAKPSPETIALIHNGMRRHTASHVGPEEDQELSILARTDEGEVVGAVLGRTGRGWLYMGTVWVDERYRGQNLGRQLIEAAEAEARRRGCRAAHLNTFSYEARPFYEKLGYVVFGTLDDFPQGHQRHFMYKRLDATAPGDAGS